MSKLRYLLLPLLMILVSCGEEEKEQDNSEAEPAGNLPAGSPAGGSNNGGSLPGGSNNGGSLPGGSNNGGSLPGGSNNGGSLPGGSEITAQLDQVELEFLNLSVISINDKWFFPSLWAHLLGGTVNGENFDFVCFNLTNTANESINLRIGIQVLDYSNEAFKNLFLESRGQETICLNPVFDSRQIRSLRQSTRTSIRLSYAINDNLEEKEYLYDLEMMPFNMIPHEYISPGYQAVFVTPNSQWVQDIQDDVNRNSLYGGFGVGDYDPYLQVSRNHVVDIADGTEQSIDLTILKANEILTINFQSIYSNTDFLSGEIELAYVNIVDGNGISVYQTPVRAGNTITYQADVQNVYSINIGLYSAAVANISQIQYTRNVSKAEKAIDYLQAIFRTLRYLGISYANINSFEDAQIIRSPNDVIRSGAANCLEGTFTFASIAELFNINSILITSLVNGHAFYAIVDEDGDIWPVETTMIGSPDISFNDAVNTGISTLNCWSQGINCFGRNEMDQNTNYIGVFEMRQYGFEPIPYDY